MSEEDKYKRSLSFWTMSFYYLNLTLTIFEKTIENNNIWVVVDDSPITEHNYREKTKFSDFNIMIPSLLSFYHGIELLLKGFVLFKSSYK
ncbi:MAG: hypothetical protein PVF17_13770, partial [Ignavibacteria bacterium]